MNTDSASLLLKPFAVARITKLSPRGRRIVTKLFGQRSDPMGINNRLGVNYYFFTKRAHAVAEALKGEASMVVFEVTHGQHQRLLPATNAQWQARIIT